MKFAFFILFISFILSAHATQPGGSGSDAGNGGGLAEKNVIFASEHLVSFIDLCLETSLCRTDEKENKLLTTIKDDQAQELKTALIFQSEHAKPGAFKIDGLVRVARTGNHVGDPVYVNSDLLYSKSSEGFPTAVDVPMALSILIHEYGHHHGVKNHAELDRLGTKLQTLVLTHEVRSEFWNGNAALSVYQLNSVRRDGDKKKISLLDRLILENRTELYDLTEAVGRAFICPDKSQVKGLRLYNISGERGTHFDEKTQILSKPMKAWFIASCESGIEFDHGDLNLILNFRKIAEENFEYLPAQTQITFIACKKNPEACK